MNGTHDHAGGASPKHLQFKYLSKTSKDSRLKVVEDLTVEVVLFFKKNNGCPPATTTKATAAHHSPPPAAAAVAAARVCVCECECVCVCVCECVCDIISIIKDRERMW